jgi:hypothetical protein
MFLSLVYSGTSEMEPEFWVFDWKLRKYAAILTLSRRNATIFN